MGVSYMSMAVNWIELAQKMAQAARAGVAIERKRLQEILAERQRKQQPHDVPESDVRRRYQRSFKSLLIAIERADRTILFDNSTEEGYRLIAVLGPSGSQWFEPVPDWAKASRS